MPPESFFRFSVITRRVGNRFVSTYHMEGRDPDPHVQRTIYESGFEAILNIVDSCSRALAHELGIPYSGTLCQRADEIWAY